MKMQMGINILPLITPMMAMAVVGLAVRGASAESDEPAAATGAILLYDKVGDLRAADILIKNSAQLSLSRAVQRAGERQWLIADLPEDWYLLYRVVDSKEQPITQWLPVYPGWETGWLRPTDPVPGLALADLRALPRTDPTDTEGVALDSSPVFPGQGLAILSFQTPGPVMINGDLSGGWYRPTSAGRPCFRKPGGKTWIFPVYLKEDAFAEYRITTPENEKQLDSANTLQNNLPAGRHSHLNAHSLLFLPELRLAERMRPASGVPAGTLEEFTLNTAQTGYVKKVTVWLPPGYPEKDTLYRTIYFQDAQYFLGINAPVMLDHYVAEGKIDPLVAVFIHYTSRGVEYDAGKRGEAEAAFAAGKVPEWHLRLHELYMDFIKFNLIPAIEQRYSVGRSPAERGIIGGSRGSLVTASLLARHPGLFGKIACLSYPFRDISETTFDVPVRLWYGNGELEQRHSGNLQRINAVEHMLAGKAGVEVKTKNFSGGHNWTSWMIEFPNIYRWWWRTQAGPDESI